MARILLIVRFLFARAPDPQGRDEGGHGQPKFSQLRLHPTAFAWLTGRRKLVPMQLEGCISCSGDSPSIAFISSKAKSSLRDPCLLPRDLDVSLPTRSVALFSNSVFLEQAAVTAGPGQQKAWQCQALIQGLCVFFMSDKQTGSLPVFTCFVF